VPNRFDLCRCGAERSGAAGAIDTTSALGEEEPQPRSSSIPWFVLGIVTVVAAGGLIALQVIPGRPRPQTAAIVPDGGPALVEPGTPVPAHNDAELTPGAFIASSVSIAPISPIAPNASAVPTAPAAKTDSLEDVVSRAIPAIVSIEVGQSRGSGFFAAPRTVITNRHVIQNNVSVTVRLSNGQTMPGRVDASSTEYDLAVVRVDSALPSQPLLPLGTVTEVRPGQEVLAIGLALGVFQNSVTRGIVSAIRRSDRTVMLQTDAAINPGNSGGPLLDRQGQVIGINTLKVGGQAESLGFAVAADHARALLGGTPLELPAASAQPGQQIAPAFGGRSASDIAREEGNRRYSQIVEAASRQAVELDTYWSRIKANCNVRVAPGYDREWFGLWDGRTSLNSPDAACGSAAREFDDMAAQLRAAIATAQEDARRSSVLPGELRDIRRRYRMDWAGFDR